MKTDLIISHGNTFVISSSTGDVGSQSHHGFFFGDIRHISNLELSIDNTPAEVLTSEVSSFDRADIFLTNAFTTNLVKESLVIVRERLIKDGVHEDIGITNYTQETLRFNLMLKLAADFADIFEVKTCNHKDQCKFLHPHEISINHNKSQNYIEFTLTRDNFTRRTKIAFSRKAKFDGDKILFPITLAPKEVWNLCIFISFISDKVGASAPKTCVKKYGREIDISTSIDELQWSIPRLETDWNNLMHAFNKSIFDLASLHIHIKEMLGKNMLIAGGIPWYMAVFGRDSLITAYQTFVFGQSLAKGTIKTLANYQGKKIDKNREEEPGKILHEMRFGEVAHFEEWAKFPYYGTVDATPLFLILLSEIYQWSGEAEFIMQMKESTLSALEWIDIYGDVDNDGFIEYQRKLPKGLINQNWRDSYNSMFFASGVLAESPIASADIQGYVYDAKIRLAKIAKEVWRDENLSKKLISQAEKLKERFNQRFWVKDGEYFAIGLDKDKKQIDTLSSSIGHLLWSGIVDSDKVSKLVKHLFSKELYSGWGVRTVSSKSTRFNPIGYHTGTVWPHDNSLIAAGLAKAGYKSEAIRIIEDMLSASSFFSFRLPEVFAGFNREESFFPVEYPTASSPQAWAAGTPVLLLRLLLGIEPDLKTKTLKINPTLPKEIHFIRLDGISAFGKHFLIEATHKKSSILEVEEWTCHLCRTKVKEAHRHNKK